MSRVRNDLERQTINEDPITPECRLAICIYRLGRGDYYYTIAEMAGLGALTVHEIVTQVCRLIVEHLWEECVMKHMPCTDQEFKQKMKEMKTDACDSASVVLIHTRSEVSSDSDSAYDSASVASVASVNQPLLT